MRNKFNAKSCNWNGNQYDSRLEMTYRALVLEARLKAGEISDIQEHQAIEIFPGIKWKVDFSYIEDGERVWDEVKGFETGEFRVKLNIWKECGPGTLNIIKGIGSKFKITKTIIPRNPKIY